MNPKVLLAMAEVASSRNRVRGGIDRLRGRLTPASLGKDALTGIRSSTDNAIDATTDAVRKNPLAAVGIVSALALFLFRKPIAGAYRRLTKEKDND